MVEGKNKKGEVDFSASPDFFCDPQKKGFDDLVNGVTVWNAVEPIEIPFDVEVQRFIICKDGTVKPPDVIGNLQILRSELNGRVRELAEGQKLSIAHLAKALGISVTTVRRVCRTLKIGIYSETNAGIVSLSSQVPFGYDVVQGRLVRKEMEWSWVLKIHEMREQGMSLRKIADFLTSEGVPTKNGGRWHAKTVSQILMTRRKL